MGTLNSEVNDRIRGAFLSLLNEKGYSKMTFKEVASATGMTRQNLYYYYESKECVLKDVIEESFDRLYLKMESFKLFNARYENYEAFSEALLRELAETLIADLDTASSFFSEDIEPIFIDKLVIFIKRLLGGIIREQGIVVNDPQYIHYLALQLAGAFHFPVKSWIQNDRDFDLDKFIELMLPIFNQIVPLLEKN